MNISLTPELEAMIRERVDSGRYASASEVVREALRIMERKDQYDALRREIQIGIDQAERGELVAYTRDMMAELIRESEEAHRLGKSTSDFVEP
jgi:antitoxin ParD1/3/4